MRSADAAVAKRSQGGKNRQIQRQMRWETPVLAGVTETAASDIEAANFCRDRGDEEDHNERSQNRQRATIEQAKNQGETTKNFQPRQIKREADSTGPWQNFVIVDIVSELDRIECFKCAGINENSSNDKIDNAPDERLNHLTI
jgi:hypothetical protein